MIDLRTAFREPYADLGRNHTTAPLRSAEAGQAERRQPPAEVAAVRTQDWKLVGRSYYRHLELPLSVRGGALLFDPKRDPSESYNLAKLHPDVVADLQSRFDRARAKFEPMGVRKAP